MPNYATEAREIAERQSTHIESFLQTQREQNERLREICDLLIYRINRLDILANRFNSVSYSKNKPTISEKKDLKAVKEEIPVDGLILEMRDVSQTKTNILDVLNHDIIFGLDEAIDYLERHI